MILSFNSKLFYNGRNDVCKRQCQLSTLTMLEINNFKNLTWITPRDIRQASRFSPSKYSSGNSLKPALGSTSMAYKFLNPFTNIGTLLNFWSKASEILWAGSVEIIKTVSRIFANCVATEQEHVVFPTPPLPPTKIHLKKTNQVLYRFEKLFSTLILTYFSNFLQNETFILNYLNVVQISYLNDSWSKMFCTVGSKGSRSSIISAIL